MLLYNLRWSLLLLILRQLNLHYVTSIWPSSNTSTIQLLGLFQDEPNTSDPTDVSVHSRAMFQAAILLSQKYNITIQEQFIEWQTVQTGGIAIDAISGTCEVVSTSNIFGIVGPAFSRETPIIADFTEKVGIPVISYAATDPDLSDRNTYPSFYRTVPSDNSAAMAIVKLFIQFNWTSCIIIYQNDAFGTGGLKAINDAFIKNGLTVLKTLVFDITTLRLQSDLKTILTGSSTRIVVVWAFQIYINLIVEKAINSDVLGPLFTWILSSSISLDSFNETVYPKLIGMLTVEPVVASVVDAPINTTLLNAAYDIWQQYEPETFPGAGNVNYYALFAFDATWLLIESLQQLCLATPGNISSCVSFTGSSFCFDRRFLNSNQLFNTINAMTFLGVSGLIKFNINETDRINGSYYLSQNSQNYSNSVNFVPVFGYSDYNGWYGYAGMNPVIWPGDTLSIPSDNAKLNGISLRIGVISSVPYTIVSTVKNRYGQQNQTFTGYMPDLINLLQTKIGFIPTIELAPSNLTYDQIVQSVADGIYDIVVADVTATSARTKIVDFSSSIYDTSLVIVTRKTPNINDDMLFFLKPFSFNLWLLIFVSTIVGGIVFCLLEREDNEAFHDRSMIYVFGMSLWYSFCNIVGHEAGFYARTIAGRLVTFGIYILSVVLLASYIANLVSDLTISQSANSITGLDDIKNGMIQFNRIGILVGSASEEFYLEEISYGRQSFNPMQSIQEIFDCLLNGTIDVSFIEIGIAQYVTNNVYCNLTIVGDSFDDNIIGIVMSKQWLYERDLDINVLALRESGDLDQLKSKWFDTNSCSSSPEASDAIQIGSMGGLFLVFIVIGSLSLLFFAWKKGHIARFLQLL